MTTITLLEVSESSAQCAAFNKANSEAIELGIMQGKTPDARTLEREKRAALEQENAAKLKAAKAAVYAACGAKAGMDHVDGVALHIESIHSGGSKLSSGHFSGWKLIVGPLYGSDKKWLKIGKDAQGYPTIDASQINKATAKIAKRKAENDAKENAAGQKAAMAALKASFKA